MYIFYNCNDFDAQNTLLLSIQLSAYPTYDVDVAVSASGCFLRRSFLRCVISTGPEYYCLPRTGSPTFGRKLLLYTVMALRRNCSKKVCHQVEVFAVKFSKILTDSQNAFPRIFSSRFAIEHGRSCHASHTSLQYVL